MVDTSFAWYARLVDIDAIRTLLVALREGSFTGAGTRLGLPASTVSRRVRALEEELGRPVLVRTARGVQAAPEAAEVVRRLRAVVTAVEDALAEGRDELPAPEVLRITVPLEMGLRIVPDVLIELRATFPDVLVEAHADSRRAALTDEGYDVAVRVGALSDSSHLGRRLATLRLVIVVHPDAASELDAPQDLEQFPLVSVLGVPSVVSGTWSGAPFSVRPTPITRVATFSSALRMVEAGAGCAVVPAYVAGDSLASGRVAALGVELPTVPVHALYPQRHRSQPVVLALLELLSARLAE